MQIEKVCLCVWATRFQSEYYNVETISWLLIKSHNIYNRNIMLYIVGECGSLFLRARFYLTLFKAWSVTQVNEFEFESFDEITLLNYNCTSNNLSDNLNPSCIVHCRQWCALACPSLVHPSVLFNEYYHWNLISLPLSYTICMSRDSTS